MEPCLNLNLIVTIRLPILLICIDGGSISRRMAAIEPIVPMIVKESGLMLDDIVK